MSCDGTVKSTTAYNFKSFGSLTVNNRLVRGTGIGVYKGGPPVMHNSEQSDGMQVKYTLLGTMTADWRAAVQRPKTSTQTARERALRHGVPTNHT
jgi:hypothetical protein